MPWTSPERSWSLLSGRDWREGIGETKHGCWRGAQRRESHQKYDLSFFFNCKTNGHSTATATGTVRYGTMRADQAHWKALALSGRVFLGDRRLILGEQGATSSGDVQSVVPNFTEYKFRDGISTGHSCNQNTWYGDPHVYTFPFFFFFLAVRSPVRVGRRIKTIAVL